MTDRTLTVKTVKTVDVNDLEYELWCGAQERWEAADEDTREAVFDRVCDWTADDKEVDMTTVNDIIWFECDDLFFPEDDEEDDDEDEDEEDGEEALCFDVDGEDESKFVDRYGIHQGRITCDGCHSVFDGNPFVDDGAGEYCSKECAEANGATGVHEDLSRCQWCDHMVHGCWWSDNDGNFFCSRICAIRYNVNIDEKAEKNNNEDDDTPPVNTILVGRIGGEFKLSPDGYWENTIVHTTLNNGEETVTFVTVRFRGKQAELAYTHLSKGDLCCIEGRRGEETTDTGVVKQYIEAGHITFLATGRRNNA